MEPIIQQLRDYREQRQRAAEYKYSQVILRFDHPQPGDAQALHQAMLELNIDEQELESDIQLLHQYRAYLGRKDEGNPAMRGGRDDAQNIRKMHARLFLAMDQAPDEASGDCDGGVSAQSNRAQ